MDSVYLNGHFVAPAAAKVSVFDRGFVFGDGVYEVIPVYGGRLFRLRHHLARLARSLAAVQMQDPMTGAEWQRVFERLVADNGGGDQSIYLQITRGVAPRDHAFPADAEPTVFAYAKPVVYPDPATVARGIDAVTVPDIRWLRCDIKAIALLPNVLMRQQAVAQGAGEAILVREGFVSEGAASNIFIVEGGRLLTPPNGALILPGVTRDLVLELARADGVETGEETITERQLKAADEVWLTSSTREILPIVRVDGQPIGTGRPGGMHNRIFALYQRYKQAFRANETD